MKNKEEKTGFSDPYCNSENEFTDTVHDYISLWTWANLDEDKHELIGNNDSKYDKNYQKVKIEDIVYIEAILHSNPRWGGQLTNRYDYFQPHVKKNINEETNFKI